MTVASSVQQHPASVDAYIRHGWSLVPIPMGTKGPRTPGWNLKSNALKTQGELPPGYGIGLAHAYSGTMALDIDDWGITSTLLHLHGIDLQALYNAPEAVIIDSGRQGHGKLLYTMPFGLALPSKKILHAGVTAYELRCATSNGLTVQDVLPPSIHPDTKQSYRWAGSGNWMRLPVIPQPLLDLWQSMLEQEKARTITTDGTIDSSWEEIRQALEVVPADCTREEWVNAGMALHWAGSQTQQLDQALHLWNEWSATAQSKYPGEREIVKQWSSFRSDKATAVKLGTLFHIAKQHGWTRPSLDVSEMFKNIEPPKLTPASLSASLRPQPPEIDLSLWPTTLAQRAQQISGEMGCDPLVPLFAGLSAICGAVDARSRLELMPRFKVPPVLWLMTIGSPALKKSPGSKPMLQVLPEIEHEDRPRYQKELLTWEGKEASYSAAKKSFLEWSASPEALLGSDQAPHVPEMPPQPVPVKITIGDITSQKMVRSAADRPRGLLLHLDEMNSWIRKMTDKSSGDDRSAWVVSYESDRYEMDRVGAGSIHCENLAVSIYANVQPEIYRQSVPSLAADGLLQRFIPAILREKDWGIGEPIPDFMTNIGAWENSVRLAYSLPATTYRLSSEAYDAFREFQHWYNQAKQDEVLLRSGNTFLTAFGKLEGTVGRLALLWHIMENPFSPTVNADVIERVVGFVKGYVIPAYRYAYGEMGTTFEEWVVEYVIQYADKSVLTLSDIKRSARRQLEGKNNWLQDQWVLGAMQVLEEAQYVIRMDDGSREHMHQAQWAIDPRLMTMFADYRREVIRAKQRQKDFIYKLSTKEKPRVYGSELLE